MCKRRHQTNIWMKIWSGMVVKQSLVNITQYIGATYMEVYFIARTALIAPLKPK